MLRASPPPRKKKELTCTPPSAQTPPPHNPMPVLPPLPIDPNPKHPPNCPAFGEPGNARLRALHAVPARVHAAVPALPYEPERPALADVAHPLDQRVVRLDHDERVRAVPVAGEGHLCYCLVVVMLRLAGVVFGVGGGGSGGDGYLGLASKVHRWKVPGAKGIMLGLTGSWRAGGVGGVDVGLKRAKAPSLWGRVSC